MTMRKSLFVLAFCFTASSALAAAADFDTMDADASGGLSLSEVQAVAPNVTVEEFSSYDADASGELSQDEFAAWVSSSDGEPTPQ